MNLHTIIERAKRHSAVLSRPGQLVLHVRIDGHPVHLMANAVAAFQSEIEDLFLRKTEIVGGGSGCLLVDISLGKMSLEEEHKIAEFFRQPDNLRYFSRRYGITAASVKRTPSYT